MRKYIVNIRRTLFSLQSEYDWDLILGYLDKLEKNSFHIYWNQQIILFKYEEDATAFKLRFLI